MSEHLLSCPQHVSERERELGIRYPGRCTCNSPTPRCPRTLDLFEAPAATGARSKIDMTRASDVKRAEDAENDLDTEEIRDGEEDHEGADDDLEGAGEEVDAERPLDALPVLTALQLLGEKGATTEELQREIEAAGSGKHPRGSIWRVVAELVERTKVRQEGAGEVDARFWLIAAEDPAAVIARRVKLVLTMVRAETDEDWALGDLITDAGYENDADRAEADVEALVAADVIGTKTDDDGTFYGLTEAHVQRLEQAGAEALVRPTVEAPPSAEVSDAPADRTKFERDVEKKYEEERKARIGFETKLTKLTAWLDRKGLSVDSILDEKEKEPTTEATFMWKESRVVDDHEKGIILDEMIALQEKMALNKAQADAKRLDFKAKEELIKNEIEALGTASKCNTREVKILARREPDWTNKVFRVVADADGRELGTEPMPKGTQRPLLAIDDAPSADGVPNGAGDAVLAAPEAVDGFKVSFAEKTGKEPPVAPVDAPVLVDMATLTKFEKDVYESLKTAGCAVSESDLPGAVVVLTGRPFGGDGKKKVLSAAAALAERGVILREGDSYRLFGAPVVKAAPVTDPTVRVEELLRAAGMLTTGEIAQRLGLSTDEVKGAFAELKQKSKLTSDDGKTRSKKYGIAGAATQALA